MVRYDAKEEGEEVIYRETEDNELDFLQGSIGVINDVYVFQNMNCVLQ